MYLQARRAPLCSILARAATAATAASHYLLHLTSSRLTHSGLHLDAAALHRLAVELVAASSGGDSSVSLTSLARAMPDAAMEVLAADHGGLRAFLEAYPQDFVVQREPAAGGAGGPVGTAVYHVLIRHPLAHTQPLPLNSKRQGRWQQPQQLAVPRRRRGVTTAEARPSATVAAAAAAGAYWLMSALLTRVSPGIIFALDALFRLHCTLTTPENSGNALDSTMDTTAAVAAAFVAELMDSAQARATACGCDRQCGLRIWALLERRMTAPAASAEKKAEAAEVGEREESADETPLEAFATVPVRGTPAARHVVARCLADPSYAARLDEAAMASAMDALGHPSLASFDGGNGPVPSSSALGSPLSAPKRSDVRYRLAFYVAVGSFGSDSARISTSENSSRSTSSPLLRDTASFPWRQVRRNAANSSSSTSSSSSIVDNGSTRAALTAAAEDASPSATGTVASYNVFRMARVLQVGEPVALAVLSPLAAALSTQALAPTLALWHLQECIHASGGGAKDSDRCGGREPRMPSPLLQLYTQPHPSVAHQEAAATPWPPSTPSTDNKVCKADDTLCRNNDNRIWCFGKWVTAVAVSPGAVADAVPPLLKSLPRAELEAELALVTEDARAVDRALRQRRQPPRTGDEGDSTVFLRSNYTGLQARASQSNRAHAETMVGRKGDGSSLRVVKATHPLRIDLLRRRRELQRAIAIADTGPSPLLHPEVLAYAIYDAMPTLADTQGPDELPLVPLGALRDVLPEPARRTVATPLKWVRAHPQLFYTVPRAETWMVVRRDVHDALLQRKPGQQRPPSQEASDEPGEGTNGTDADAVLSRRANRADEQMVGPLGDDDDAARAAQESSLYDHSASLHEEKDVLHHVASVVAEHLTHPRRGSVVPASASADTNEKVVRVGAVPGSLPRVLRRRIKRIADEQSRPQEGREDPHFGYMERYLRIYPHVFVVDRVASAAAGTDGQAAHSGQRCDQRVPSYCVRLTPEYSPTIGPSSSSGSEQRSTIIRNESDAGGAVVSLGMSFS